MIRPYLSDHAEMRMLNRGISYDEVVACVNLGCVQEQHTPPNTFAVVYRGLKVVLGEHGVITTFRLA